LWFHVCILLLIFCINQSRGLITATVAAIVLYHWDLVHRHTIALLGRWNTAGCASHAIYCLLLLWSGVLLFTTAGRCCCKPPLGVAQVLLLL
jgi:hypothetical protein